MAYLSKRVLNITTTGGAGVATGSVTYTMPADMELYSVKYDAHASLPATADLTISSPDAGDAAGVILTQANSLTDKRYYPRKLADKAVDGAASAITELPILLRKGAVLTAALAQADALTNAVVLTFIFRSIA